MTQIRNRPIPRPKRATSENVGVEIPDPTPFDHRPGMFDSWAEALTTIFAVAVVALGILAGTLLLGWSMFRVADFLGLLSS
jgi:hypothetical protein